MQYTLRNYLGTGSAIALCLWGMGNNATEAQPIPDTTLGSESSTVVPIDAQRHQIEGGAIRGANLFHSFQEFNIQAGNSAYFANPTGIENILSRVTGSNPSHLYGTLGVLGEANLFFLNPNGIFFGLDARLDVRGSFVASTAESLVFPNGEQFSATNPEGAPLLSVNVPLGLQFGENAGMIVNRGDLAIDAGGNLTLAGGMVVNTGVLSTSEGSVNVLAVQPESSVRMDEGGEIIEIAVSEESESLELEKLEELAELEEETGLRVTETGEIEIVGTGIKVNPEAGLALVSGEIEASGGVVRVLGNKVGAVNAEIDVSSEDGGGTILLGGNYRGENSLLNASQTFVNEETILRSDGLVDGDGGKVVVWGDETTGFYGNISARGGDISGNGGFVEVSGKEYLEFRGRVNTSASHGDIGTLLLDPTDIVIRDGTGDGDGNSSNNDFSGGTLGSVVAEDIAPTEIYQSELEGLSGNTNIILEATNNIAIDDLSNDELEFKTGNGTIEFKADADGDGTGSFSMNSGDTLKASGRNLSISGASIVAGSLDTSSFITSFGIVTADTGGMISLTATNGSIQTEDLNSYSSANTLGTANGSMGGMVKLIANGQIQTGNINTYSIGLALGNANSATGGEVRLNSTTGDIKTGNIDTRTVATGSGMLTSGNGGRITFNASGDILPAEINTTSTHGTGGNITLTSQNGAIFATEGNINSSSLSSDGGKIEFKARNNIVIANILNSAGNIQGGDIIFRSTDGSISNSDLTLINSGNLDDNDVETYGLTSFFLSAASMGRGDGGDIILDAQKNISLNEVFVNSSGSTSQLNSTVGASGTISFKTSGDISLDNAKVEGQTRLGEGGDLNFTARSLFLTNSRAGLRRSGNEDTKIGDFNINATNFVELQGSGLEIASGQTIGEQDVKLQIDTNRLTVRNSVISTLSDRKNPLIKGADLIINTNLVEIFGVFNGEIPSTLISAGLNQSNSGDITINSNRVNISNGGAIVATSVKTGQAGDITINANLVSIDGTSENQLLSSGIASDVLAEGSGGNITINSQELIVKNGAGISTSTFGMGPSGTIDINVPAITLDGTSEDGQIKTGIYAQSFDAGVAGNVNIETDNLTLQNSAKVSVSSDPQAEDSENLIQKQNAWIDQLRTNPDNNINPNFRVDRGMGNGNAGDINISANEKIIMQNQAQIVAETSSGEGGNINIAAGDYLLMRHESKISTTAGTAQAGGNGGDININAGFIVAVPGENSDITANAFTGNGGNINITTNGLFGIQPRSRLTPRSDITASSDFGINGNINITLLATDPSNNLNSLPVDSPEVELKETCQAVKAKPEEISSLRITGKEGLPVTPASVLPSSDIEIPLSIFEIEDAIASHETQIATTSLPREINRDRCAR